VKLVFPNSYGTDSKLVEIDASIIPFVAGALENLTKEYAWSTEVDYELGYNAIAQLKEELMGRGIAKLQMEIRAARGVDELDPNYNDPEADPFTLQMGTLEGIKNQLETANAKLEAIELLIQNMSNAETLEDIKTSAAQIALLLA
jgi:hypothetical protein